jgi:SAM-dependent methyltransferase
MDHDTITEASLARLADEVGELRGWDFSRVRDSRDPVPWEYMEVARRYLRPTDRVLDVGTGGGERFLELASAFGEGVGIDAFDEMVRTARTNTPAALAGKVRFERMRDEELTFADDSFDVVLCRHAGARPEPVARVLRPGGYFVTQGVGERNTQSVFDAFGWGSNGEMWRREALARGRPYLDGDAYVAAFEAAGCAVVARGTYDVGYYFEELASLVFWLKAVPLPEELDPARHWRGVRRLVRDNWSRRGVRTNEHRELLVARKGGGRR